MALPAKAHGERTCQSPKRAESSEAGFDSRSWLASVPRRADWRSMVAGTREPCRNSAALCGATSAETGSGVIP